MLFKFFRVFLLGYNHGEDYGNFCSKHDKESYTEYPRNRWMLEPWCVNRLYATTMFCLVARSVSDVFALASKPKFLSERVQVLHAMRWLWS